MLLWRLLSQIMPTRARLAGFIPGINTTCPLCELQVETYHHLILDCPVITAVWWNSKWHIRMAAFQHLDYADWILLLLDPQNVFPLSEEDKEEMLHYFAISLEHCWLMRNKKIHGDDTVSIFHTGAMRYGPKAYQFVS